MEDVSAAKSPSAQCDVTGAGRLSQMFRALQARNFRLFFAGQGLSLIGTWMTSIATNWLIFRLTGSALLLGVVGFTGQIPAFFLSPLAGVLVDRWSRHRLLIATQILAMIQSLTLALLTLTHHITVTHVILLSLMQGLINAFDVPARQAFLVQMVGRKDDLPNAIALNSSMFNGARLVGPSLAGMIIALSNEGVCFLIDGVSYIAVILALLAMHVPAHERDLSPRPVIHEFMEGVRYVTGFRPIGYILMLLALISLVGVPYTVLMPVISSDILHGGSNTFGFLMAAAGLGALAAALYMASRQSVLGLGRLIVWSSLAFGLALFAVALSRFVWLTMAFMVVVGFTMMIQLAGCNTLVQTLVEDDKRGRVMSLYTMAFMGTVPIGSLLGGALAHRIGAPRTLMISCGCCLLAGVWFARVLPMLREQIRPIYRRLGILPEIASGLETASVVAPGD